MTITDSPSVSPLIQDAIEKQLAELQFRRALAKRDLKYHARASRNLLWDHKGGSRLYESADQHIKGIRDEMASIKELDQLLEDHIAQHKRFMPDGWPKVPNGRLCGDNYLGGHLTLGSHFCQREENHSGPHWDHEGKWLDRPKTPPGPYVSEDQGAGESLGDFGNREGPCFILHTRKDWPPRETTRAYSCLGCRHIQLDPWYRHKAPHEKMYTVLCSHPETIKKYESPQWVTSEDGKLKLRSNCPALPGVDTRNPAQPLQGTLYEYTPPRSAILLPTA